MKKLRLAQIGVGYWGPNLLRNIKLNPRCEVAIVVDKSKQRRDFVHDAYPGTPTSDSLNSALCDPTIDAIILATPANTHFDLAMLCLKAGKHILVEKPFATSVEQVDQIDILAKKNKLVAMAAHTFIYNDAVKYLKNVIHSGDIGDIRYIYSRRLNLGRIRSDVDALWNLAPHDISIIQYLLGNVPPTSVKRMGMDFLQPGIEDVTFLHIEYPNKIIAHVHVSWLDPQKIREMTIVGSKKMIVYDDTSSRKIAIYDKGIEPKAILGEKMDFDSLNPMQFTHRSGEVVFPDLVMREPIQIEINHFLDCIEGKCECETDPAHAKEVIRILQEATSDHPERHKL